MRYYLLITLLILSNIFLVVMVVGSMVSCLHDAGYTIP
jgi:hypothetical protein